MDCEDGMDGAVFSISSSIYKELMIAAVIVVKMAEADRADR
jgi:hypothetical protein